MEQIYKSQYTGPQIDEAIGKVGNSIQKEAIVQSTGTSTDQIMSQNAVTTSINTLMPKSGGAFTGAVKFNENDGNCINYDNGFYINKTGGSTLIGTDGASAWVGTPDTALTMRGNAAKPTYNGKYLALEAEAANFATASWATIASISATGEAYKYFKVGDEKTITMTTGEQITLVILDFNHDRLTSGGRAGITIGMKNLLATKYRLNATTTNAGGWTATEMRTTTMQTLLSQLPTDLQGVIKPVNKTSTLYFTGSSTAQTNPAYTTPAFTISSDKLWLLALSEVYSSTFLSSLFALTNQIYSLYSANFALYCGEGTQYEYYANTVGNHHLADAEAKNALTKNLSNGTGVASYYWLRTASTDSSAPFWYISNEGEMGAGGNSSIPASANDASGVCFGFCV